MTAMSRSTAAIYRQARNPAASADRRFPARLKLAAGQGFKRAGPKPPETGSTKSTRFGVANAAYISQEDLRYVQDNAARRGLSSGARRFLGTGRTGERAIGRRCRHADLQCRERVWLCVRLVPRDQLHLRWTGRALRALRRGHLE